MEGWYVDVLRDPLYRNLDMVVDYIGFLVSIHEPHYMQVAYLLTDEQP